MAMKISGALCVLAIVAIIGAFIFAPGLLNNGSGPGLLIFLICPISMVLMMWSMWSMKKDDKALTPPAAGSINNSAEAGKIETGH